MVEQSRSPCPRGARRIPEPAGKAVRARASRRAWGTGRADGPWELRVGGGRWSGQCSWGRAGLLGRMVSRPGSPEKGRRDRREEESGGFRKDEPRGRREHEDTREEGSLLIGMTA